MSAPASLGARAFALAVTLLALLAWASPAAAAPAEGSPEAPTGEMAGETGDDTAHVAPIELDARGHVVVPTPSEAALSWHRSGNVLWIVKLLWALLIPGVIVFTGFSARLRDWFTKGMKRPWLALLAFLIGYEALTFVIDLPLSYYAGFHRPHDYGLSEQQVGKWFGDQLKGLMLVTVALCLFVPGTLWFVRKSPERWWIWTSMVAVPLAFLILMLTPVFISPMFNDFGPMKDAGLEGEILALAERAGIEGSRVFEVEKSVDTKTVNAYVTGFLSTKRIVLWDTIIARLSRDELLVVMGHEMGHYVLGHVRNSMLIACVTIPGSLWLFHVIARVVIARWRERLGFDSLGDVAALPLFFVLIGLFGFVGAPLANAWSRHQEHESDRFALELTQDNLGCAMAFAKLQQSNYGHPRPGRFYVLWRASHPTLGDRIDFCNDYRPWETGGDQAYVELFSDGQEPR